MGSITPIVMPMAAIIDNPYSIKPKYTIIYTGTFNNNKNNNLSIIYISKSEKS